MIPLPFTPPSEAYIISCEPAESIFSFETMFTNHSTYAITSLSSLDSIVQATDYLLPLILDLTRPNNRTFIQSVMDHIQVKIKEDSNFRRCVPIPVYSSRSEPSKDVASEIRKKFKTIIPISNVKSDLTSRLSEELESIDNANLQGALPLNYKDKGIVLVQSNELIDNIINRLSESNEFKFNNLQTFEDIKTTMRSGVSASSVIFYDDSSSDRAAIVNFINHYTNTRFLLIKSRNFINMYRDYPYIPNNMQITSLDENAIYSSLLKSKTLRNTVFNNALNNGGDELYGYIIAGGRNSGKSTLTKMLKSMLPHWEPILTTVTRPEEVGNEVDKKEYITLEEFKKRMDYFVCTHTTKGLDNIIYCVGYDRRYFDYVRGLKTGTIVQVTETSALAKIHEKYPSLSIGLLQADAKTIVERNLKRSNLPARGIEIETITAQERMYADLVRSRTPYTAISNTLTTAKQTSPHDHFVILEKEARKMADDILK